MQNKCTITGCIDRVHGNGLCPYHYRKQLKYGDPLYVKPNKQQLQKCKVDGCLNVSRDFKHQLCEKHYGRMRRNGTLDLVRQAHKTKHSGGYVLVPAEGHPLVANHTGIMEYEHRIAYYDSHGAGPFKCYWCGKEITWANLHIDHLNEIKTDNNPPNLAATCATCNQKRGRHKMVASMWRRTATWIEYKGKSRTIGEWADLLDISRVALKWRLDHGWSIDRALTESKNQYGPASKRTPMAVVNAANPIEMTAYAERSGV